MRSFIVFLFLTLPWVSYGQTSWSLDSCIRYATANNITLKRSELSVELSEVNQRTALGALLPNLNAQGSHGYNWGQRIDPFTNQFASERIQSNSFGISTSVNLFNGFQQSLSYKQSFLDIERNKWEFEKLRNDVALNVASGYLQLLLTQELESIAQTNVDQTLQQVRRMERLVNAGALPLANLDQMNAQLATDDASLVSAKNNVTMAKLALLQFLQLPSTNLATFSVVQPDIEGLQEEAVIQNVDVVVESALTNFPEIKSAETNLKSSEIGSSIARGGMYPQLSASYSYGSGFSGASRVLTGTADSSAFPIGTVFGSNNLVLSFPQAVFEDDDFSVKPFNDQLRDNVNRSLFFSLTIPIFNGFQTSAAMQRAKINVLDAKLNLDQTKQNLEQTVYRAYTDAQAALANYNAAIRSRDANKRAFDWTETRYEQGVANQVEYNDSRALYDNARANVTRSKYEYVFRLKVLDFYLGKPIQWKE
jgi:outer membrane protein